MTELDYEKEKWRLNELRAQAEWPLYVLRSGRGIGSDAQIALQTREYEMQIAEVDEALTALKARYEAQST